MKYVAQTIRLTDAENKRLKRAATREHATFNAWAVTVLNEAADRVLNPQPKPTEDALFILTQHNKQENKKINGTPTVE